MMSEFKRINELANNYEFKAVINNVEIILVPQSEIVKLQQKLDDVENELFTLNEVYRMNRDYIDFVKGRLANTGFVTEQDIVDYRNEIKKDAGDAK